MSSVPTDYSVTMQIALKRRKRGSSLFSVGPVVVSCASGISRGSVCHWIDQNWRGSTAVSDLIRAPEPTQFPSGSAWIWEICGLSIQTSNPQTFASTDFADLHRWDSGKVLIWDLERSPPPVFDDEKTRFAKRYESSLRNGSAGPPKSQIAWSPTETVEEPWN
jgi:hypothetical protein